MLIPLLCQSAICKFDKPLAVCTICLGVRLPSKLCVSSAVFLTFFFLCLFVAGVCAIKRHENFVCLVFSSSLVALSKFQRKSEVNY